MYSRTLIKNVSVISMSDEAVIANQDVLIEGKIIQKIFPTGSIEISAENEVDGSGKYLLPGLFDMHTHVNEKRFLDLFLMNGVTAVRDLGNVDKDIFKLKADINAGKVVGPRLFVSGKILEGDPPFWEGFNVIKTKAQAIEAVKELKAKGADQVKVYHTLSPELHRVIIEESHKLGMKVTGHVPVDITPVQALNIGQDGIEHMSSLTYYMGKTDYEDANEPGYEGWSRFTGYKVKHKELSNLVDAFKAHKAYFCPTLIVDRQISSLANYKELVNETDSNYIEPRYIKEEWNPSSKNAATNIKGVKPLWFKNYGVIYKGSKGAIKAISEGAAILAGTDTPNPFVVPGFSLHKELELLVESGLSNFEALCAATVNAAEWLGVSGDLATVEVGKVANLLLLNADPLKDIKNTKKIDSVILEGKLYPHTLLARKAELKHK